MWLPRWRRPGECCCRGSVTELGSHWRKTLKTSSCKGLGFYNVPPLNPRSTDAMNTQILSQVLSEISGHAIFINFYGAKFVNAVLVSGAQQSESRCGRSRPLFVRHSPRGSAQRWRARPVLHAASHRLSDFFELFSGFRRCPLFVTLWTVARQDPLSLGFLGRILEWVVKPSSMGIFPTQGSNPRLLRLLHWRQSLSIV